ncbi:hypothetical protein [Nonomuraea pusilla]|uniref:Uncharacterized protein n=1 Tax=Nonomuraea pusilla TaxID=46177 RepID=A0A1H7Q5R3_9ACTN|nr:hypothetical protein [Nonomuraea pusilla]SEL43333.1 hypothetical protein SAMN05660976_02430 [Nonomuraea pusilla]
MTVLTAAFAGFLVSGLFPNRLRRAPARIRRPAALTALAGLVTVLATTAYLFWIVATGATGVDGSVLGRPPLWLLMQALAVGVIVSGVALAVRLPGSGGGGARLALLMAGGVVFVPWSAYWGLLTV